MDSNSCSVSLYRSTFLIMGFKIFKAAPRYWSFCGLPAWRPDLLALFHWWIVLRGDLNHTHPGRNLAGFAVSVPYWWNLASYPLCQVPERCLYGTGRSNNILPLTGQRQIAVFSFHNTQISFHSWPKAKDPFLVESLHPEIPLHCPPPYFLSRSACVALPWK